MLNFSTIHNFLKFLTAVESSFMPEKIREKFRKTSSGDLYLSVGYALKKSFRGRNIAFNALSLVTDFASSQLYADYIFASTNNVNFASQAVLRKSGFNSIFVGEQQTKFYLQL